MTTALERLDAQPVTSDTFEAFAAAPGLALLLISGDVSQRPEAQDVAVVALELRRTYRGLRIGLVDAASEESVKARLKVSAVPAVCFVKNGRVVSTLARIQPWDAYARAASVVFGRPEVSL